MTNEKVFQMPVSKVYPLLVGKAERKGRTKAEADTVIRWFTGYDQASLDALAASDVSYGDFFRNAPALHPNREQITGVVCGVRAESVENPLMRELRRLDKLIDELSKGKPLEKILRA